MHDISEHRDPYLVRFAQKIENPRIERGFSLLVSAKRDVELRERRSGKAVVVKIRSSP